MKSDSSLLLSYKQEQPGISSQKDGQPEPGRPAPASGLALLCDYCKATNASPFGSYAQSCHTPPLHMAYVVPLATLSLSMQHSSHLPPPVDVHGRRLCCTLQAQ